MRERRRSVLLSLLGVAVLGVALGMFWFQPWKLFTHSRLDEALPGYVAPVAPPSARSSVRPGNGPTSRAPSPSPTPSRSSTSSQSSARISPAALTVVSRTAFRSGEHRTTGSAVVLRRADGSLVVRLENFSTSDGPDVRVVLGGTPPGSDSVGAYLHLGHLKATSGNQNYAVVAGTDLSRYRSVVIWCKRFDAVFGSAGLG